LHQRAAAASRGDSASASITGNGGRLRS
jgi:hypothetical protein